MSSNITKIQVRQGTNTTRKGVVLDTGEPGFTVDSKRFYVGDGATTGGVSIGVKNWGTFNPVFSTPSLSGYSASVVSIISAVESGDFIYDSSTSILYYALSSSPLSSQWVGYANTNTITGFNGITAATINNTFSAGLGAGFTVSDSGQTITLNYPTQINTGKSFTVNTANIAVNGGGAVVVTGGGNITTNTGIVSAGIGNSNQWSSTYSNVSTNSASWNAAATYINTNSALPPGSIGFIPPQTLALAMTVNANFSTFNISSYVPVNVHAAILQWIATGNTGASLVCRASAGAPVYFAPGFNVVQNGVGVPAGGQWMMPVSYPNNTFQAILSGLTYFNGATAFQPANNGATAFIQIVGYIV